MVASFVSVLKRGRCDSYEMLAGNNDGTIDDAYGFARLWALLYIEARHLTR